MMYAPVKLRPPVKTHGGKSYLARRIIGHFPDHRVYVEPFAGGLSVLLNKPRAAREIVADRDAGLVHFYRTLQRRPAEVVARVAATEYRADVFAAARDAREGLDDVGQAVRFLVVRRMSRDGLGRDFATSDRLRGKRRPGGPIPGDVHGWETFKAELPRIVDRLAGVEVLEADALDVIRREDAPGVLVYADPPYLHATRTTRDAYAHEMTEADHRGLLATLAGGRSRVVLSGYPSALYDATLIGWRRIVFEMANHAGQTRVKSRRLEVLWIK